MKLSLVGRAVIVNQVLLSTSLWFFINIWEGLGKILRKFCNNLKNFLWAGKDQRARTRVACNVCCKKKSKGDLGLMDLKLAKQNLLCK